mmetsp:Transcript_13440/g.31233  ORF Transcript_13440/g.31233 Transcript_13440/m.31233 type:complete len:193 (-) Transcript_13440:2121-2699(-)
MWFAALGRINHNPWLISLVRKILDNCRPVVGLLDNATGKLMEGRRVQKVRAKLYHYDFTRLPFEWNTKIPGAEIIPAATTNGSWSDQFLTWPDKVWTRSFSQWYLPPLEPNNPSLEQFLTAHRYPSDCYPPGESCKGRSKIWCPLIEFYRIWNLTLLPFAFVVMCVVHHIMKSSLGAEPQQDKILETKEKTQ